MNLEKDICYMISVAGRLIKSRTNKLLDTINITFPQYLIMNEILEKSKNEKELQYTSPASIASSLSMDRPTVTGIVDRLEGQNLILREPNQNDRRSQNIRLTKKALKLVQKTEDILTGNKEKALAGISQADRLVFEACLKQIIKNFSLPVDDE